jgi:hypothetical protein
MPSLQLAARVSCGFVQIAGPFATRNSRAESLSILLIRIPTKPIVELIPKCKRKTVKVIMKAHAAFLSLAISIACAGTQAGAATTVSPSLRGYQPAAELSKPTPRALSDNRSPAARHLFPVRDENGSLLLSCVAPEMAINSETDVFKNCTLAPGRTLDDLMHSFIKAVHQEQHEQAAHGEPAKAPEEKPDEKAAQK